MKNMKLFIFNFSLLMGLGYCFVMGQENSVIDSNATIVNDSMQTTATDSVTDKPVDSTQATIAAPDILSKTGRYRAARDSVIADSIRKNSQKDNSMEEKSTYSIVVPGRLEAVSDAPVFDVPSTTGTFNHGISMGAMLLYYEEQNGFFSIMNDNKELIGWVTSSAIIVKQKPETLTIVADSSRAMFVFDSISSAIALKNMYESEKDTSSQLVFVKPDNGFQKRFMTFVNVNKRLVVIGGSVVTGAVLLTVLLSNRDNSSEGSSTTPPPTPPPGETEIPPITIAPPTQ